MRFEKLIWTLLAMWLIGGGAGWDGDTLVGAASGSDSDGYHATDGTSIIPPP